MDPSDTHSHSHSQEPEPEPEPEQERVVKNGIVLVILRCLFGILLPFLFLSSIPFLLGLLVFSVADFSIPNPISLPSQCKIISTGVDIRSSKICELGLLNYKAKDVFHHFERSKFRCRYDYYWASVFKVEYKDHFSGQTQVAFAEAPNEALPLHCRPSFGAAWLTQHKFKVNETYNCWYTSGIAKVHLNQDNLFGCHADEQSSLEKIRQYCTMAMEMVKSWFSGKGRTLYWRWETIAGVVAGFLTSLLSLAFIRFLQLLLSTLYHFFATWIFPKRFNAVLIARTCCLLAYISFVTWLVIQYGKRLGLVDIFRFPKL